MTATGPGSKVLRLADVAAEKLASMLAGFGLQLTIAAAKTAVPGSYWGESEAGLINNRLYARSDTPVHSILHESCHYICMTNERRENLHTNAGGDYDEENAVCYLQILLAEQIEGMGRQRMLSDMDAWGYSFRLGSARQWFERDAQEPRDQLIQWGLIATDGSPRGKIRV